MNKQNFHDLFGDESFGGGGKRKRRRRSKSQNKSTRSKSIWNNAKGNDIRTAEAWAGHDINGDGDLKDEASIALGAASIVAAPISAGASLVLGGAGLIAGAADIMD